MGKLQKHPDLETCKAISHLFPDSEMVYYRAAGDYDFRLRERCEHPKIGDMFSAPDCVELGEWLYAKGVITTIHSGTRRFNFYLKSLSDEIWINNLNETQARAEAIKQIIEAKE